MITEAQYKSLIDECKTWLDILSSYREKMNNLKSELYFLLRAKPNTKYWRGLNIFITSSTYS